jgi:hypothetical protein
MSITDAVERGMVEHVSGERGGIERGAVRLRRPLWEGRFDHFKIDIFTDGERKWAGLWVHLWCPHNMSTHGRDPYDLLILEHDVTTREYEAYTGPLPDSEEYKAAVAAFGHARAADPEPSLAQVMINEAAFRQYRRTQVAEMRPYSPGEKLSPRVSISATDRQAGSPKLGDMIARNPKNHHDQWLVAAAAFADNFEAF